MAAVVDQLLPQLRQGGTSTSVVVLVVGQDPLDRSTVSKHTLLSMPIARFTEEETRAYLAVSGITPELAYKGQQI